MSNVIASIVIYKHTRAELERTLESLIQSPFITQIVLVDNDQSDWANQLIHSKVIYLKSQGNFGFGSGHNLAIRKYAQQAEFFLICNPDIYFDLAQFERFVQFASGRSEGLFLPKIVYEDGEDQHGARLIPTPLNLFARRFSKQLAIHLDRQYLLQDKRIDRPVFVPYLSGCFMLFRSDALLALQGFDERFFMYMEDVDLSRRCAEQFGTIYYPLAQVVHVYERASHKNSALLKAHLKSAYQYFNKWGWIYDAKRAQLNAQCLQQFESYSP